MIKNQDTTTTARFEKFLLFDGSVKVKKQNLLLVFILTVFFAGFNCFASSKVLLDQLPGEEVIDSHNPGLSVSSSSAANSYFDGKFVYVLKTDRVSDSPSRKYIYIFDDNLKLVKQVQFQHALEISDWLVKDDKLYFLTTNFVSLFSGVPKKSVFTLSSFDLISKQIVHSKNYAIADYSAYTKARIRELDEHNFLVAVSPFFDKQPERKEMRLLRFSINDLKLKNSVVLPNPWNAEPALQVGERIFSIDTGPSYFFDKQKFKLRFKDGSFDESECRTISSYKILKGDRLAAISYVSQECRDKNPSPKLSIFDSDNKLQAVHYVPLHAVNVHQIDQLENGNIVFAHVVEYGEFKMYWLNLYTGQIEATGPIGQVLGRLGFGMHYYIDGEHAIFKDNSDRAVRYNLITRRSECLPSLDQVSPMRIYRKANGSLLIDSYSYGGGYLFAP